MVESTIQQRFADVARRHASRVALSDGRSTVSYRELERRSGAVARGLLEHGIRAGEPVAILADQGSGAVVAMLGSVHAGAALAPLDVLDPPTRAAALVTHVAARVLLTTRARAEQARGIAASSVPSPQVLEVESLAGGRFAPPAHGSPDGAASIFFTSGSTGAPKAVLDVHRNVLHNVARYTTLLGITADDRLSAIQRPSFSGVASSVFGALLNGATLCTFPLDRENLPQLAEWVQRERVTIVHSVPAIFRVLTAGRRTFPDVRVVRLEGDRATWDDFDRFRRCFREDALLANGFGTTETGLVAQLRVAREGPRGAGVLPVGRAAPDVEILVLAGDREPVSEGAVGEVAVRSSFLAHGYVGSPDLTAERFLVDPEDTGRRLYLTGDLGRIDEAGNLEILGRRDGNAKVGGVRVEPAEVEAALVALDLVRDARVSIEPARGESGALAALVVAAAEQPATGDVRALLAESLPPHMIPARIELVDELPADDNWKLRGRASGHRPRTRLEAELKAIWDEILETDAGVNELFVELGGDSLAAAEVAAAIETRLGIAPPPGLLSRSPTIVELAAALERSDGAQVTRIVSLTARGGGAPLVLVPDHRGDPLLFAELARRLELDRPVWSVALPTARTDAPSIPELADSVVSVLRASRPDGPYCVCGYCYGAILTIEVARRLRAQGAAVLPVLLGLLPTDLEALVAPDALERWVESRGSATLGPRRLRYHLRQVRRRSPSNAVAYVRITARRAAGYFAETLRTRRGDALAAGAAAFHPAPLPGVAHIVLAAETVVDYADDADCAWAGVADEVDVRLVPGPWIDSQLLHGSGSAALASVLADVLRTRTSSSEARA